MEFAGNVLSRAPGRAVHRECLTGGALQQPSGGQLLGETTCCQMLMELAPQKLWEVQEPGAPGAKRASAARLGGKPLYPAMSLQCHLLTRLNIGPDGKEKINSPFLLAQNRQKELIETERQ